MRGCILIALLLLLTLTGLLRRISRCRADVHVRPAIQLAVASPDVDDAPDKSRSESRQDFRGNAANRNSWRVLPTRLSKPTLAGRVVDVRRTIAAADSPTEPEASSDTVADQPTQVALELKEQSWFTDVVATAFVRFPEVIQEPDTLPHGGDDLTFISLDVTTEDATGAGGSVAVLRFLPRRSGIVAFPALEFKSASRSFRTPTTQIVVGVPQRSRDMAFEIRPEKTAVYVGQPLRVDVAWTSQLTTNRIRALQCFPEIFNRPDVQTVIPRCTAPEEEQMGLPFGGRRVIAQRLPAAEDTTQFGTVRFSLFLRFSQVGKVALPATRLECAYLQGQGSNFAPYAAYFNNGLFAPLSSLTAYDRLYAESPPLTVEVLPLPTQDRSENFSGLFTPCDVEVSLSKDEFPVGQVMDVDLRVRSDAPHGMLELPPLDLQRSLRGRFRVAGELSRKWYPNGTCFRARVRPLTTDVTAFPSLRIQLFDAEQGAYRFLQTEPVSVKIRPQDGRDYFDVRTLQAEATLTDQPEGIWHNKKPEPMSDTFNTVVGLLAEYFWLLLLAGPVSFALLLRWVQERRKRAVDVVYRRQVEAYRKLRRLPEGTERKWEAFQHFLATGFSMPPEAWTAGDAARCLPALGVPQQDTELILSIHADADAADFSAQQSSPAVPELNTLARRVFYQFRKAAPLLLVALLSQGCGKGVRNQLFNAPAGPFRQSVPDTFSNNWFLTPLSQSDPFSAAEARFEQALQSPAGLPETESLFAQAALKFEDAAGQRVRTGQSWYNAGNAWFQAGELGRAIGCYRQAKIYRPLDDSVKKDLAAARALVVDVVEQRWSIGAAYWPVRWICAALVLTSFLFWALLLVYIRYRTRVSLAGWIASLLVVLATASAGLVAWHHSGREGVVIVSEIYGRKGPAYAYSTAFNEPLHDGLEFRIVEPRSDWLFIELADGRRCWIPSAGTQVILNPRM